jgi:hypothetical protein
MKYTLITTFLIFTFSSFAQETPNYKSSILFKKTYSFAYQFDYQSTPENSTRLFTSSFTERPQMFMPTDQFVACPTDVLNGNNFTFLGRTYTTALDFGRAQFNTVYMFDMNGVLRDHQFSIDFSKK